MTKRQLWLVYGITIFMLVIGLEVIHTSIYQDGKSGLYHFSPFDITYVIYVMFTLLLVRFLLKKFFPQKRYFFIFLSLIGMFPIFMGFRYFLEEFLAPLIIHQSNYNDEITIGYYIADNISYALYYILIGVLLYFLDYTITHQKKVHLLEAKHREAELNYLRAQFNPHFLFNSLNNIYSLVSEKSDLAAEAVMRLSDLTRYLIYEKEITCPIKDELIQTENYITLQQLRFDYPLPILKTYTGAYEDKKIPPFTLVTLIENAFKHGDFKDKDQPMQITIQASDTELNIQVSNKIGKHNKDNTSGVGLANIRKRLDLIFPGSYSMSNSIENNIFTLHLTIRY